MGLISEISPRKDKKYLGRDNESLLNYKNGNKIEKVKASIKLRFHVYISKFTN